MFFTLSKILWALVEPLNLLVGGVVIGTCLVFLKGPRAVRTGRVILATTVIAMMLVSILPFNRWLVHPLENRFPVPEGLPDEVAGIVVAGGVLDQFITQSRQEPALNSATERLFAMARLAKRYPQAQLIYSAGSGRRDRQDLKEADFIQPVLAELGISADRVILENRSRNTYENAVFSREIASPRPGETWILVTSAFHMPRAVGTFRAVGWDIIPYPTDFNTPRNLQGGVSVSFRSGLHTLSHGLHEWLGLTFYRLTGRTNVLFPAPSS